MFDVIQHLKEIAYNFGLIKDYVIERGTDGMWTYEIKKSGDARCWTTETHTYTGVYNAAVFSAYAYYVDVALPAGLFKEVFDARVCGRTGSGYGISTPTVASNNLIRAHIIGNQKLADLTINYIEVFGTHLGGVLHNLIRRRCSLCLT